MLQTTTMVLIARVARGLSVTLTHSGTLASNVIGHTGVLTKAAYLQATATDGMAASLDNDYLKHDDEWAIAHIKIIGGRESDTVTLAVSELSGGEEYAYFCSFPGHVAIRRGALTLVD